MQIFVDLQKNVEIAYIEGQLHAVQVLVGGDFNAVKDHISVFQASVDTNYWRAKKVNATKAKVALWCKAYAAYTAQQGEEVAYKVSGAEAGMLKNVEITQELLYIFFTTNFWTKTKTISNYQKHYNEIRQIQLTGQNPNQGNGNRGRKKGDQSLADALQKRYGSNTDGAD